MTLKTYLTAGITLISVSLSAEAQTTYYGNGSTEFNGAIGNGSLTLSDNGTTISGSLTTGAGLGGNAFVLYLQAGGGGFSSTSGFNDDGDQLRSAISEYGGAGEQSILDFTGGFAPNYAIALQPGSSINYGGLWQLADGGSESMPSIASINLSPTGSDAQGTYSFSFNLSQIGLTPGAGQSFELFGLEVSTTGYSSTEALGGTVTGSAGWSNTQTENSFSTYTTEAVPEPTSAALFVMGGFATLFAIRRRR